MSAERPAAITREKVCRRGHDCHAADASYCYRCGAQLYARPNPSDFEFEQPLRVIEHGTKKCFECGKPHNAYAGAGTWWGSWKDPNDGHPYRHA